MEKRNNDVFIPCEWQIEIDEDEEFMDDCSGRIISSN